MVLELKERIIAYFDILGYKNTFEKKGFDSKTYLTIIKSAFGEVKSCSEYKYLKEINTKIRIFSDNVIIVMEGDDYFSALLMKSLLSYLQYELLVNYDILIRGSIVKGEIYMDDDIVYGDGLIKCVELEEKAVYPRIVLQEGLEEYFNYDGHNCVEMGFDGQYEILYLRFDEDEEYTDDLKKAIIQITNDNCKHSEDDTKRILEGKAHIIKKYSWLIETYNMYNIADQIGYNVSLNSDGYLQLVAYDGSDKNKESSGDA